MKIFIISDTHFGFKENDSQFQMDSYISVDQAFKEALLSNADLILMPGDIFDLEVPSQETYDKVFKLFNQMLGEQKTIATNRQKTLTKIPIIIIPGTHEFRGKQYKGPIDVLESSGYVYQIDNSNIIFEQTKTAIFGMKGVPEKVSKDLLKRLDFKPLEDHSNILLLHQSFKEFLPYDDEMVATLTFEDLPKGFDLYVNGHIHLSKIIDLDNGSKFALPGSTIYTQIKKMELEQKKGFIIYDTLSKDTNFTNIPVQREYNLIEIKIDNASKDEIYKRINEYLDYIKMNTNKYKIFDSEVTLKPVVKIKLSGKILSGFKNSDISAKDFIREDIIVIIDKSIESNDLEEKIKSIDIVKEREDIYKNSKHIFSKNLEKSGFKQSINVDEFINQVSSKDTDDIAKELVKDL